MCSFKIVLLSIFLCAVRSNTLGEKFSTMMTDCQSESEIQSDELVDIFEGNPSYSHSSLNFLYCFSVKLGFQTTKIDSQRLENVVEKLGIFKGDVGEYVENCLKDIDETSNAAVNAYMIFSCLTIAYNNEKKDVDVVSKDLALEEIEFPYK